MPFYGEKHAIEQPETQYHPRDRPQPGIAGADQPSEDEHQRSPERDIDGGGGQQMTTGQDEDRARGKARGEKLREARAAELPGDQADQQHGYSSPEGCRSAQCQQGIRGELVGDPGE
nr:hypothetical protein [Nocardia higoensis]